MSDNKIIDSGDLRKYRTELPNLIDDLGLSVFAYRLYGHFKRVCGANGGTCMQGTRTMSDTCKMSMGKISQAKTELEENKLITITRHSAASRLSDEIQIVDIWAENFNTYAVPCSPHEQGCSPHEHKKEPIKNIRTPPKQTLARKLSEITKHKKEWSEQLKEWHTLDTTALQKEVGMWQGYKRKYPQNKYADKCLDYLSELKQSRAA